MQSHLDMLEKRTPPYIRSKEREDVDELSYLTQQTHTPP